MLRIAIQTVLVKKQTNIQIYFIPRVMLAVGTIFCKLGLYWKQGFIKLRYVYRLQVRYFKGILNSCSFFLISSFLNRMVPVSEIITNQFTSDFRSQLERYFFIITIEINKYFFAVSGITTIPSKSNQCG